MKAGAKSIGDDVRTLESATLHTIHMRSPLFIPTTLQVLIFLEKEVGGSGTYEISHLTRWTPPANISHCRATKTLAPKRSQLCHRLEVRLAFPSTLNIVSQAK